jgi:uncharacterized protein (DUF885 family)
MGTRQIAGAVLFLSGIVAVAPAQRRPIADFFRDFTAEWIRSNPNQAASTRFFTGDEQRQFERQLTPYTREWRRARVALAEKGLKELRAIDLSRLNESERLSAELMAWQLDAWIRADRYNDYSFPFEQLSTSSW